MERNLLVHLPVILKVAKCRNFAAAAAELGISPSAVSHSVKSIETVIGKPIFARTTRSVSLTEIGQSFIEAIEPALGTINNKVEELISDQGAISGHLRLSAGRICIELGVGELITQMSKQHPNVNVEIIADEKLTDIVDEGFDAGIRIREMVPQDMVAVRVTPNFRPVVVASPDYVEKNGLPNTIHQLSNHICIGYRLLHGRRLLAWSFVENGEEIQMVVPDQYVVSESFTAIDLCLSGVGLAYVFEPLVASHIQEGRLLKVFANATTKQTAFHAYFPRRAQKAPKLRAFLDIAKSHIKLQDS